MSMSPRVGPNGNPRLPRARQPTRATTKALPEDTTRATTRAHPEDTTKDTTRAPDTAVATTKEATHPRVATADPSRDTTRTADTVVTAATTLLNSSSMASRRRSLLSFSNRLRPRSLAWVPARAWRSVLVPVCLVA